MSDRLRRIPDGDGSAYPWWGIVDPRQILALKDGRGANDAAFMITGPWFSRGAAQGFLDATRYNFGPHAIVWCFSGHASRDWRALCQEPPPPPKVDPDWSLGAGAWTWNTGRSRIVVHHHIHHDPLDWFLSVRELGWVTKSLTARDPEEAKAEAVALVRSELHAVLAALGAP